MKETEIKKIIESLLFASPIPLTQTKVNNVFNPATPNLKKIVESLNNQYDKEEHAFEVISVAGGFQIVSKSEYEIYIQRMLNKSLRISLSAASMDCLAIIAYRQPISRYQIEAIRGVDSSGVIKNLLGKNLVKIKGRDSGPGRPLLYKTTDVFLEYFGINRLSDLPKLKEISEIIASDASLGEQMAVFENQSNEKAQTDLESDRMPND
tara:strand:- start:924 stop:1547 length:624 start_codon:yes stop_codon:yes gene_type:complete